MDQPYVVDRWGHRIACSEDPPYGDGVVLEFARDFTLPGHQVKAQGVKEGDHLLDEDQAHRVVGVVHNAQTTNVMMKNLATGVTTMKTARHATKLQRVTKERAKRIKREGVAPPAPTA